MRMCGHAHHDDMLYLGKDAPPSWSYPPLDRPGVRRPRASMRSGRPATRFLPTRRGSSGRPDRRAATSTALKREAEAFVEAQAQLVIAAPWPEPAAAGAGVLAGEPPRVRIEVLDPDVRGRVDLDPGAAAARRGPAVRPGGQHVPRRRHDGHRRCAARRSRACSSTARTSAGHTATRSCCCGRCSTEFGDRILNSILAEGAVLGVCVGAALAGQRPIGEMQFNDFVATGFNQLVNNAAKIRYRWGGVGADGRPDAVGRPAPCRAVPQPEHRAVVLPHPGLKIVVPSTPSDARALMASGGGRSRSGPVLRAHRALPRSADQAGRSPPNRLPVPIGKAALRRAGDDLAIISYGAYVHAALRVAERWPPTASRRACSTCARWSPLDRAAVLARRAPLQPGADRARGRAHRRDRRKPRRDHPGGGVRIARRARPHPRRARHARSRTRRRSRSSTWRARPRSNAPRACSPAYLTLAWLCP